MTTIIKISFAIFLLIYGIYGALTKHSFILLNWVNLLIHESGHPIFGILQNEFIQFMGGTIMQLLIPLICAFHFFRLKDFYSASIMLWWHGQNYFHIAPYIKDARSQILPLLGGGRHDWAYMLGKTGLLEYDQDIGSFVWLLGFLIVIGAAGLAIKYSRSNVLFK